VQRRLRRILPKRNREKRESRDISIRMVLSTRETAQIARDGTAIDIAWIEPQSYNGRRSQATRALFGTERSLVQIQLPRHPSWCRYSKRHGGACTGALHHPAGARLFFLLDRQPLASVYSLSVDGLPWGKPWIV